MLHPSVLLGSSEKRLSVFDSLYVEVLGRLISKGSSDRLPYDMFCGRGAVGGMKSTSIQVSVRVKETYIGHRLSFRMSWVAKDEQRRMLRSWCLKLAKVGILKQFQPEADTCAGLGKIR